MVPSISFSGRECRHADKIFAFPARTEFSVTRAEQSKLQPRITRRGQISDPGPWRFCVHRLEGKCLIETTESRSITNQCHKPTSRQSDCLRDTTCICSFGPFFSLL